MESKAVKRAERERESRERGEKDFSLSFNEIQCSNESKKEGTKMRSNEKKKGRLLERETRNHCGRRERTL